VLVNRLTLPTGFFFPPIFASPRNSSPSFRCPPRGLSVFPSYFKSIGRFFPFFKVPPPRRAGPRFLPLFFCLTPTLDLSLQELLRRSDDYPLRPATPRPKNEVKSPLPLFLPGLSSASPPPLRLPCSVARISPPVLKSACLHPLSLYSVQIRRVEKRKAARPMASFSSSSMSPPPFTFSSSEPASVIHISP